VNEVERQLIEEIVDSVATRHEESKRVGSVGTALQWIGQFNASLRRVIAKYEKALIVIPRPTVAVRSSPDSGSKSDPSPAASESKAAGRRQTASAQTARPPATRQ